MFVFGRLMLSRRIWRAYHKLFPTPKILSKSTVFDPAVRDSVLENLRVNGIAGGLILPAEVVAEILKFAASHPYYGNAIATWPIRYSDNGEPVSDGAVVGDYLDGIRNCPPMVSLCNDRMLLDIAGEYLGTRPRLLRSRLWWSFATKESSSIDPSNFQGLFHYDLDDWLAVKFFFYLTDVDIDCGPHGYIQTSHLHRPLRDQLVPMKGRSNDFLESTYGLDAMTIVLGPAGTGIVQDPFGYHAGQLVRGGRRLMLEIEFGVSDMAQVGPWVKATDKTPEVETADNEAAATGTV